MSDYSVMDNILNHINRKIRLSGKSIVVAPVDGDLLITGEGLTVLGLENVIKIMALQLREIDSLKNALRKGLDSGCKSCAKWEYDKGPSCDCFATSPPECPQWEFAVERFLEATNAR
jgi:hypothetical protein